MLPKSHVPQLAPSLQVRCDFARFSLVLSLLKRKYGSITQPLSGHLSCFPPVAYQAPPKSFTPSSFDFPPVLDEYPLSICGTCCKNTSKTLFLHLFFVSPCLCGNLLTPLSQNQLSEQTRKPRNPQDQRDLASSLRPAGLSVFGGQGIYMNGEGYRLAVARSRKYGLYNTECRGVGRLSRLQGRSQIGLGSNLTCVPRCALGG